MFCHLLGQIWFWVLHNGAVMSWVWTYVDKFVVLHCLLHGQSDPFILFSKFFFYELILSERPQNQLGLLCVALVWFTCWVGCFSIFSVRMCLKFTNCCWKTSLVDGIFYEVMFIWLCCYYYYFLLQCKCMALWSSQSASQRNFSLAVWFPFSDWN